MEEVNRIVGLSFITDQVPTSWGVGNLRITYIWRTYTNIIKIAFFFFVYFFKLQSNLQHVQFLINYRPKHIQPIIMVICLINVHSTKCLQIVFGQINICFVHVYFLIYIPELTRDIWINFLAMQSLSTMSHITVYLLFFIRILTVA